MKTSLNTALLTLILASAAFAKNVVSAPNKIPVGIVNDAKVTPYYENGSLHGFKVLSLGPRSPLKLFEIRPTDILIKSNGQLLNNTSVLQKEVGGDLRHHTLTILRDGKEIDLGK